MFFVYMIKNEREKLYVGISKNPDNRVKYHNQERGALFTKYGNFKIVFLEEHQTLLSARQREIQIKKWRREKKELLINKYKSGLATRY